jgi:hypothetical protein
VVRERGGRGRGRERKRRDSVALQLQLFSRTPSSSSMEATQTLGPGEEAMENNGEMPSASAADVTVLPLIPISRLLPYQMCYSSVAHTTCTVMKTSFILFINDEEDPFLKLT